ncbi:hypothetical protein PVAP13_8KG202501 [Panicum virgatum]|uniref:Uncharacterized protein n=1 Tax=Panicum virgatum TaxID=38727 RepID=A0A8T0PHS1_PANVG|nr:hypothetical protein PVAP13_8KG202501 [Panicum virgatum]
MHHHCLLLCPYVLDGGAVIFIVKPCCQHRAVFPRAACSLAAVAIVMHHHSLLLCPYVLDGGVVIFIVKGSTMTRLSVLVSLHQEDTLPRLPVLPVQATLK